MSEEQNIKLNKTSERLVRKAIYQDCGICKNLYHGTSKYNAHQIQDTAEINILSDVGYLGSGFYCYQFDEEASKIWAKKKYENEKIAILGLVANLGNTFFICKELNQIFYNKAIELRDINFDLNKKIGYIIELFIKKIIKPDYNINIHTVGKSYLFKENGVRPVLMYSLRDKLMVKKIEICWEE